MPTFNILLAQDVSHYGNVAVDAATWQEAVASLTDDAWNECREVNDVGYEQRVVHVEEDDGAIVAEDIAYSTEMVHQASVIQRLREIQLVPDDMDAALAQYIDELRTTVRDPIFNKEDE